MSGRSDETNPLRSKPFRWLVTGATVSRVGGAMAPVALAFAVLDLTGSATDLGLVVGARSLTNVLFLLLGGVVADRLPRGLVMVASSLAGALTQGTVAALVITRTDSIATLAVLSALNGAVAAFSLPAAQAVIPQTVPAPALVRANAVSRLGANAANILGAALAGIVVVAVGAGGAIVVDAAGFLLAGICYGFVRFPGPAARPASGSVLHELREGWSAFRSRTWLWVVVAAFTVLNAAYVGGISVLGPVVADASFGRRAWGFVLAGQAVGFVVGGLFAMRLLPRRMLAFGMACMAAAAPLFAVLAVPADAWVVVVASVVAGFGLEQFGVAWQSSLHRHIPEDLMARVSSYDALGSFLAVPAGEVAAGPLSDAVGVRTALFAAGALYLAAVLAALASRSVHDLTEDPVSTATSVGQPASMTPRQDAAPHAQA